MTTQREWRLENLALEGAARRVRADLARDTRSRARPPTWAVLLGALMLFLGGFALRLSVKDPGALIANFYTVPIALLAILYGVRAGLAAAGFALLLVWAWGQLQSQHLGVLGYSTRLAVFLLVGGLVGWYSERLREDMAERRLAVRELALRAEDLVESNTELTRAVTRLEAFAEIARAVGGETELERVLNRILEHGRAIVEANRVVVYLERDGRLVANAGHRRDVRAGERDARSARPGARERQLEPNRPPRPRRACRRSWCRCAGRARAWARSWPSNRSTERSSAPMPRS